MVFLAPVLGKVLEAAQDQLDGLASQNPLAATIPEAIAFVNDGIRLFAMMAPGILRTRDVNELFRQIGLEQQAQLEALDALAKNPGKAVLARYIISLRSASERLLQLFPKLQEEEAKEKVYSPFPVIDHIVRVGINVLDGKVPAPEFQTRLPAVAGLIANLRQDVERFRLLYGRQEQVEQAAPHLERLAAGLGAAYSYIGNQDKTALQDSLRLLGSASVGLMEVLQTFDASAQADIRYHSLRFLEELGRTAQRGEPTWLIERAWSGIAQAVDYYRRETALIAQNPLRFEVEGSLVAVQSILQATQVTIAASDQSRIADGVFALLAPLLEQLDQSFRRLQQELHAARERYQEAPNLNSLRELIGHTLNGSISPPQFMRLLGESQKAHSEMLKNLEAGAVDPIIDELIQLSRSHSLAYARMQLFVDDQDAEHLRQGWRLIAVTLPRILELSKILRDRIGIKPAAPAVQFVSCFRCGTDNPRGVKTCKQCNGLLPQPTQEVTDYTDITGGGPQPTLAGGGGGEGTPANLIKLQELLIQAEEGKMGRARFKAELEEQLRGADRVRLGFEKQVASIMGKNEEFDVYAQFFATQMDQYIEGLQQMHSFGDGADVQTVREGYNLCLGAAHELQGFQGQIQEALRGGR